MARTRTLTVAGPHGSAMWQATPSTQVWSYTDPVYSSTCNDSGIPGLRDQAFSVTHNVVSNAIWNKPISVAPTNKAFADWTPDYFGRNPSVAHLTDPSRPTNAVLAVQAMSRTNPSRAKVDLPVSLLELRELPDLLLDTGLRILRAKSIPRSKRTKHVAKTNLEVQFGWLPLVGDFFKLLSFQEDVAKRLALFKKIQDKGSLLRKVRLYAGSVSDSPMTNVVTNSSPGWANVNHTLVNRSTKRQVWGYVRWTPSADFSDKEIYTPGVLYSKAAETVLGLHIDAVTAWEALPWSWLADWFGNIGDWLSAHRSVVPIIPSTPRICETTTSTYSYSNTATNGVGMAAGVHTPVITTITKTRTIQSALLPSAAMPVLTGRQASILASLYVLRS